MSECVVRMDFPDDNCPIGYSFLNIGYCPVEGHRRCDFIDTKERPSWCPIICQLPEGHGRLVDGDKLMGEMKNRKWMIGRASDPDCLVFDAPTIVPAERSET